MQHEHAQFLATLGSHCENEKAVRSLQEEGKMNQGRDEVLVGPRPTSND